MNKSTLLLGITLWIAGGAWAAGQQLLDDPGFESGDVAAWDFKKRFGVSMTAVKAEGREGTQAVQLKCWATDRFAVLSQSHELEAGVYEFTCWAKGQGAFRLKAEGLGVRAFTPGPEWAHYSYVFEVPEADTVRVLFEVSKEVIIDDAALTPADEALQAAWTRQQEALEQFYYIPSGYSAQRPAPNAPKQPISDRKPVPMTRKVIFFDPRYESSWNTECDQIADWFRRRGFAVKDAPALVEWMEARITAEDAYGSVAVMGMGLVPKLLVTPLDHTCVLRRYLDAGGRVVWTGDTVLYVAQAETGPIYTLGKQGGTTVLNVTWDPGLGVGEPVLTKAGKRWGLESAGTRIRAVSASEVTLSLSENKAGAAAIWLKTTNPAYPLSGFLASVFPLRGSDSRALRDFYRLALFTGEPVDVPTVDAEAPPEAAFVLSIEASADGQARRAFVRGEVLRVALGVQGELPDGDLAVRLFDQAPPFTVFDQAEMGVESAQRRVADAAGRLPERHALWRESIARDGFVQLDTADFAVGDYLLQATVLGAGGEVLGEALHPVALCPAPRTNGVYYGTRGPAPRNAYRLDDYLRGLGDLKLQGVETGHIQPLFQDAMLRHGLTFIPHFDPRAYLTEPRVDKEGNLVPNPWAGGRPGLVGIAGAQARENAREGMAARASEVAGFPALRNVFTTSDDFSALGGPDYCEANLEAFKQLTGLDAPREPTAEPGVIPDDDPWLLWFTFLSRDVLGAFNDALTDGLQAGSSGAQVWPVPGGAQYPLFSNYSGQYPPFNFGEHGFNTVGYYCYLSYWAPTLTYLYWSEVARLGNRDLPVWVMPDAGNARHYLRNQAHTLLAGNTKGIVYFTYSWMGAEGRKEIAELGGMLESYGPLLRVLTPAPKRAALLVPFSQSIYSKDYPLRRARMAFCDLVQCHVDIELIAEEELAESAHNVLFLTGVTHLKASSVQALERLAQSGTRVLVDSDTTVAIAGSKPLELPLGTVPYGNDERTARLADLASVLAPYDLVGWDSPEPTTMVRPFVGPGGGIFLYLVDLDTAEEYRFYRRNVYEVNTFGRDPEIPKEDVKAFLAEHGMQSSIKDTTLTVTFPADRLPAGWQVVDLYTRTVLPVTSREDGRCQATVSMPRYGGALLAIRPPVALTIEGPAAVKRDAAAEFTLAVPDLKSSTPVQVTLTDPDSANEW